MIRMIERDGGTRYQVYGRRNGKQVYVTTCDSRRAAKEAEEDFRATQRQIGRGELVPEHDNKISVSDALDRWLKALDASEARSRRAYGEFVKYQIKPKIGGAILASVRKKQVTWWRDALLSEYSATTINSALGCLSSACSWFVEQGIIAANPCRGVKPLEIKSHTYNWIKTRGELERLLASAPTNYATSSRLQSGPEHESTSCSIFNGMTSTSSIG